MIAKKKIAAITLSTIMAAAILTGCGTASTGSSVNETDQTVSTAKTANIADYKGSTFTGRVTSINGNEVTVSIGGGPMGDMGQLPDFNSENGSKQAPPDFNKEDGNMPAPPDKNSDDNKDNSSSDKSNKKEHESKTITFTIDDESILEDMTISDIAENTVLTVSVDDNGKISKITKLSDNMKPDKNGERPNKDSKTSDDNTSSDSKADDNNTNGSDNGESSL